MNIKRLVKARDLLSDLKFETTMQLEHLQAKEDPTDGDQAIMAFQKGYIMGAEAGLYAINDLINHYNEKEQPAG